MNQTEWLNSDGRKTDYSGVKNLSATLFDKEPRFLAMQNF